MSKTLALFALKYSVFNLPWEIKAKIIQDFPSTGLTFLLKTTPELNWPLLSSFVDMKNTDLNLPWNEFGLCHNKTLSPELSQKLINDFSLEFQLTMSVFCDIDPKNIPDYFTTIMWQGVTINTNMTVDDMCNVKQNYNTLQFFMDLCLIDNMEKLQKALVLAGKNNINDPDLPDSIKELVTKVCPIDTIDIPFADTIHLNPGFRLKHVKEYMSHPYFNWAGASQSPGIYAKDIISNNFPWDWSHVSSNPNVNLDFVLDHITERWDWDSLSVNPGITIDDILLNWDVTYSWHVSGREKNTIYIRDKWNFYLMHRNPSFKMSIVLKYPDKKWDYFEMSSKATFHDIMKLPDKNWDFDLLSYRKLPPYNLITRDKYLKPDNTGIKLEHIIYFADRNWNLTRLILNPSLSTLDKMQIRNIITTETYT